MRHVFKRAVVLAAAGGCALALLAGFAHQAVDRRAPPQAAAAKPSPGLVEFVVPAGTPPDREKAVRAAVAELYPKLLELTGSAPARLSVRLYRTLAAFLEALKRTGEIPPEELSRFQDRTRWSPRPIRGSVFVPPDVPPRELICHDLISAFLDALSDGSYRRAKWLDVGLGVSLGQRLCPSKSAPRRGRLFLPLGDLATPASWSRLSQSSTMKAGRARAEAGLVVQALLERYGVPRILGLLRALRRSSLEEALRTVLGLDLSGVEALARARYFRGFAPPPPLRPVDVPGFPGRVLVQENLPPARVEAATRAFVHAHQELLRLMGRAPRPQTLRLFATRERFLEDLYYVAGMDEENVDFFRRGVAGAPRPIDGEFYVPPDMDIPGVCHELTHQFFEALAGNAFARAKWLDEGLAMYFEARLCEGRWPPRPLGPFIPLARITSGVGWHELMEQGKAGPIYSEARLLVTLLDEKYGDARLVALARAVASLPLEDALKQTLGLSVAELEQLARARFWTEPPPGAAARKIQTRPAELVVEAGVPRGRVKQMVALYGRATSRLARHTGARPAPQTLRLYRTREAMQRDLETVGRLPRPVVARFGKGWPVPPWKGQLYVPPEMTAPELCRLVARVFIEERWPTYDWAMWLSLGYASYLARRTCEPAAPLPSPRGAFVPLKEMASKRDWVRLLGKGEGEAIATEALLVVQLLVERSGEERVAGVFADLYQLELEEALRKNLHLGEEEIARLARERFWP